MVNHALENRNPKMAIKSFKSVNGRVILKKIVKRVKGMA
jgi:hypothetical protein